MMRHVLLAATIAAALGTHAALAQPAPPVAQSEGPYPPPDSSTSVDGQPGPGVQQGATAPDGGANIPPQMTPDMRRDIAVGMTYRLPDDFMPRAASTVVALRDANIQPPDSTGLSLEQTITRMQAIPGLPAVLSAHGFDARSFVLGMTAFGMTLATDEGRAPPAGMPQPDPANLALFRSHPDQVQALVQAIGTPPGPPAGAPQ